MTSLRAKLSSVAAVAAAAALVLSGCATSSDEVATGGEALPDEQQNLTFIPAFGWAGSDISAAPLEIGVNMAISQTLEALVVLDQNSVPQPKLAESWEWVDETTLVLNIREGVQFSDGTPLTAADAKGSLERYIAFNGPLAAVLKPIVEVEATDDQTLTIRTSNPTGTLVGVLSLVYIGKAEFSGPDNTIQAHNDYWAKPVGTGPFVISEYVANDRFVFERNDNYWGEKAKLKTLTMKQVTDVNGKITALANGEAHVVGDVPYDQVAQVKGMDNVTFTQQPSLNYYFLWFDNKNEFLQDQRVREAMWAALDLKTIQESLFGETASTMEAFCPTSAFGCVAPSQGMVEYDVERAKELLADAGYADGFTVDAIYSTANGAGFANMMQAFISAWQEIGVTVEPRALDPASWLSAFTTVNPDGTHGWDLDVQPNQTITGDADYTIYRLYNCAAGRLGYCNEEFDAITLEAQQIADPAKRLELYQKAADIMRADTPAIPLLEINVNVAAAKNVQGIVIPPNAFIDFRTVYLTN